MRRDCPVIVENRVYEIGSERSVTNAEALLYSIK